MTTNATSIHTYIVGTDGTIYDPQGNAVPDGVRQGLDNRKPGTYEVQGNGADLSYVGPQTKAPFGASSTPPLTARPTAKKATSKASKAAKKTATVSPAATAAQNAPQPSGTPAPSAATSSPTSSGLPGAATTGGTDTLDMSNDQALGLENFPLDANGNPVYTPPLWIAGYGPIAGLAGNPTAPSLGGGHPGGWAGPGGTGSPHQVTGQAPRSISDPNKPWYRQSDAWAIASQPEILPQVKAALVKAGLLDPTKMATGAIWTSTEAAAMAQVMTSANIHGISWNEMLSYLADHPNSVALQVKVDNPGDIQSLAERVISPLLGHDLSASEMQKFVQDYTQWQFHQQEAARSQATQPADQQPQETVSAETPDAFAEQYAKQNYAGALQGHAMLGYLNQIVSNVGPTVATGG